MRRRSAIVATAFALVICAATSAESHAATLGVDGGPVKLKPLRTSGFRILGSFEAWSNRRGATAALRAARSVQAVPLITWEPWAPPPLGTKKQGAPQRRYSNATIAAGRHDRYIRQFAKSLARYERPVYIRFAHEFPGTWYPWSTDPKGYRQAWRRMHLIFRRSKADNVRLVWSPQIAVNGLRTTADPYWPGSKYVDYVSTSFVYFGAAIQGPHQPMVDSISQLRAYGKPVIISEANAEHSVRYEVMRSLADFVRDNRWIRAVVWSQSTSRGQRNLDGTRMEWSLRADAQAVRILQSMR